MTLKAWSAFCRAQRRYGDALCLISELPRLNRFRARYQFARRMTAVVADGYTDRTLRGYAAGLRVQLAANAAELLEPIVGRKFVDWQIVDVKLASELRDILTPLIDSDMETFHSPTLRDELKIFQTQPSNIRVAATAIRILFAHGSFTPTGTGALNRRGVVALHQLADGVLNACEQHFERWFEERMQWVETA